MNIESRLVQETCMKNLTKVLIFSAQILARSDYSNPSPKDCKQTSF